MQCLYCNNELELHLGYYKCASCKVKFEYLISLKKELGWIIYEFENYILEISVRKNKTYLLNDKRYNIILELNYIPDINPSNAKYWFDKLLNLATFS